MSLSAQKPFSESYGEWVTRLRLASSQRRKQAQRIKESAGSAWPTPRASEQENRTTRSAPSHGKTHGLLLAGVAGDMMAHWPTPTPMQTRDGWTAEEIEAAREREKAKGINGNGFGLGLGAAASMWPTPKALQDTKGDTGPQSIQRRTEQGKQVALAHVARTWPTPAGRDYKGENSKPFQERGGGSKGEQLPNFVAFLFTHPHQKRPTHGVPSSMWRPISRRLFRSAMSNVSQTTLRRWLRGGSWRTQRLNPWFVEWLMGWPPEHALCHCSETAFTRWQQDMRGALSALPSASCQWIWEPPAETTTTQLSLFPGAEP